MKERCGWCIPSTRRCCFPVHTVSFCKEDWCKRNRNKFGGVSWHPVHPSSDLHLTKLQVTCFHNLLPNDKPPPNLPIKPTTISLSVMLLCFDGALLGVLPLYMTQVDIKLCWDIWDCSLTCPEPEEDSWQEGWGHLAGGTMGLHHPGHPRWSSLFTWTQCVAAG